MLKLNKKLYALIDENDEICSTYEGDMIDEYRTDVERKIKTWQSIMKWDMTKCSIQEVVISSSSNWSKNKMGKVEVRNKDGEVEFIQG